MARSPTHTAPYLQWWYMARDEPLGIFLTTPNVNLLRNNLYYARHNADDPSLASLVVKTSPSNPTGELWIINPTVVEVDPSPSDVSLDDLLRERG